METKKEVRSGKRGLWAILKESMNKASSGCGPGCSCHVEKQGSENRQKDNRPDTSRNDGSKRDGEAQ